MRPYAHIQTFFSPMLNLTHAIALPRAVIAPPKPPYSYMRKVLRNSSLYFHQFMSFSNNLPADPSTEQQKTHWQREKYVQFTGKNRDD